MKTLHPDLFPETLLVDREGDRVFTTSLKVAEHFQKRHTHVLRAIENLFDEMDRPFTSEVTQDAVNEPNFGLIADFQRRNFQGGEYQDTRGRAKPMYKLTEESFALLAMGFTGKEALVWKIKFLAAFREMERQLHAKEERFASALDQIRPYLRPVVEATEQGLSRSAIAEPLGKSPGSITYHRRQARRFGLIN